MKLKPVETVILFYMLSATLLDVKTYANNVNQSGKLSIAESSKAFNMKDILIIGNFF